MLILDCLSNPVPRTALAGPRSLHCNIKSLNIYWISLVFANVLKPNKMLTTPALFRLFRVNCPVGQKEMFLILDGNLVRELILWLFKMMIKIIDMWMIIIPDIWLNFSFRGLRICGKVGIGSANQTGIDIKNSKFTEEEERHRNGKCIYFAAASLARLWTLLQVSLWVPFAASNWVFFAAFLAALSARIFSCSLVSLVSLVLLESLVSLEAKWIINVCKEIQTFGISSILISWTPDIDTI